MAKLAGPIADVVLKRVYAYGGVAHSIDFVIETLSRCQRVVNTFTQSVVPTGTLSTLNEKLLYTLRSEIDDCIDIIEITESNRRLARMPALVAFEAYASNWWRTSDGTRFEAWKLLARDLLFVYPAKATDDSVAVTYTKLTDELKVRTDAFDLPDEEVELASDLAEIVLLARDRQMDRCREKVKLLTDRITGTKANSDDV